MATNIRNGFRLSRIAHPDLSEGIDFREVETESDLKGLSNVLLHAIEERRPDLIIGGISSAHALAIGEIAESKKIPFIAPYATGSAVTKGKEYVFTACFSDSLQASRLAEFVKTKRSHWKRGASIFERNDAYSDPFRSIFREHFEDAGHKIVLEAGISNPGDFDSVMLKQIKEAKVDFVLLPLYQASAAGIVSYIKRHYLEKLWVIGSDSWVGGRIFQKALLGTDDSAIETIYVEHWDRGQEPSRKNDEFRKYWNTAAQGSAELTKPEELREKSGMALAYDSTLIALLAMRGGHRSPEQLLKSIRETKIEGVTGKIDLTSSNSPSKPIYLFSIDSNKDRFVGMY
jgi:branched-chain amino acid transport system substrate-binding protein